MLKIQLGQTASFSEQEVNIFANLSLDFNPVHLDQEFAQKTVFGK